MEERVRKTMRPTGIIPARMPVISMDIWLRQDRIHEIFCCCCVLPVARTHTGAQNTPHTKNIVYVHSQDFENARVMLQSGLEVKLSDAEKDAIRIYLIEDAPHSLRCIKVLLYR